MRKVLGCLVITFIFSTHAFADLMQRTNEEIAAGHAYPCPSQTCPTPEQISSYQFIFIDGLMGKVAGKNFIPIRSVLKEEFGVSDFTVIFPNSAKSVEENVNILYKKITQLRSQSVHKKALIISHSKGGAEMLLLALQHPEMITSGVITDMVFVDGAFNGSPLAYLWRDFCHSGHKEQIAAKDLDFCESITGWAKGVDSLKPSHLKPVVSKAIASMSIHDREQLNKHLWSVQSQFGSLKTEWKSNLLVPYAYLKAIYGDNDGAILTKDEDLQRTLGLGTNLGLFFADHNSLLDGSKVADAELEREGFARALVRQMVLQSP